MNQQSKQLETELMNSDRTCLIQFSSKDCAPCQIIAPTLEEVEEEFKNQIKVFRVDVDESPALADDYGITQTPTTFIVKSGRPYIAFSGIRPKSTIIEYLDLD